MAERIAKPVVSRVHRPLLSGGSCMSWRSRVTARTVRPPTPHQRPPFAATGLLDGHRLQRLPGAAFSVADRGVAFTECGQHLDRQTVETAILVGPPFTQYCLGT
jgi:hypothetical protein